MSTKAQADWRADLAAARDLGEKEKRGYGFLLGWFEDWRLRKRMDAGRVAAVAFWREQVESKSREAWQRECWADALSWYLGWLVHAKSRGDETRSVGERIADAVNRAGARRG